MWIRLSLLSRSLHDDFGEWSESIIFVLMITVTENSSLRHRNTFGMDVNCRRWIEYTSPSDIPQIVSMTHPDERLCIGEGSNILFTQDYPGDILYSRILDMEAVIEPGGDLVITAGSGICFDELVERICSTGHWGFENLTDIPGQVGASAVQNIGAYGVEVKDLIDSVACYDSIANRQVVLTNEECEYGYRDSVFKHLRGRYIVHAVTFRLRASFGPKLDYGQLGSRLDGEPLTPLTVRNAVRTIRAEKLPDPSEVGSAGSFFKNPVVNREEFDQITALSLEEFGADIKVPHYSLPDGQEKIPAAWLIERAGWKGRSLGNAAVWGRQPLILVNATGKATPAEIIQLENQVTDDVYRLFGVRLSPEVDHI